MEEPTMPSRHDVDTGTTFDATAPQPETREIERADAEVIAPFDPPVETVPREPYIATEDIAEAVNIAIALGRPLLLQGDPGCGKTRLAHAVAYALRLPLERAYIKSTTRAQDLLSMFDAVGRLYDVQLGAKAPVDADGSLRPDDPANYIRLGALGRAFQRAGYGRRSVVLIDEIDKADLDFPNDLLHELDRLQLTVPETGETYAVPPDRPELRPIIFVTHNEEKALPPAFLRRCVYHELRFPTDDRFLVEVLAAHDVADADLVEATVGELRRIHNGVDLTRQPGLSELIDWARYLYSFGATPDDVRRLRALGALIKSSDDAERIRRELAGR
jgi:MoxR-like ATPase